jgi:hypothetical protein
VVYASSSSALATGSALYFSGTNLGIGTSSPASILHTSVAGENVLTVQSTGTTTGTTRLRLFSTTATAAYDWYLQGDPTAGALRFFNAQTSTEAARITQAGNVGIGTSSPQAKLEVGGAGQLYINQDQRLQWNIAGSTTIRADIRGTSGNAIVFGNRVGGVLTDTMTLDGSGNLGLGVTPSAWESSYKAFQFGAGSAFVAGRVGALQNRQVVFGIGASHNGTNWLYTPTGVAVSNYTQTDGAHQWFNAPSGTAGNAITFTQAMTLDASGRLGIGTTIPTAKIQGASDAAPSASGDMVGALMGSAGDGSQAIAMGASTSDYTWIQSSFRNNAGVSAGSLRFYMGATERARFPSAGGFQSVNSISVGNATPSASGAGITFPATQSASSDANTLDDYEEGTFTPTAYGSTLAGTGTYGTQFGNYTKIGNTVNFRIVLAWSAHTGTGNLYVAGLPFTQNGTGRFSYPIVVENLTYSGQIVALNNGADTNIVLLSQTSNAGLGLIPMDTSVSYLVITGTYNV